MGAIAGLELPSAGARVVETGCGGVELLLRILECHDQATGVGVDSDPLALGRPRRRGFPGREPELIEASADDAGLEPGAFDLVVNVASSHAHGGFPGALAGLAALARPGDGLVLLGEGFWTRPPSPAFLAALGGATADELPLGLDGLLAAVRAAGLEPVDVRAASAEDWAARGGPGRRGPSASTTRTRWTTRAASASAARCPTAARRSGSRC
jgi:hypothetical protein